MRILALIPLLFGTVLFYFALSKPIKEVVIDESLVQTKVESKLPFRKSFVVDIPVIKSQTLQLEINRVNVRFLHTGKIQISSLFKVWRNNSYVDGSYLSESELFFDQEKESFYLENTKIKRLLLENLELSDKDRRWISSGKKILDNARKNLNGLLSDMGMGIGKEIVSVKLKERFEQFKSDTENKVKLKLLEFINSTPVYKIDSTKYKQYVASMTFSKLTVKDEKIYVTLDLTKVIPESLLFILGIIFYLSAAFILKKPFLNKKVL